MMFSGTVKLSQSPFLWESRGVENGRLLATTSLVCPTSSLKKTRILQPRILQMNMTFLPREFKPDQGSEHVLLLWLVRVQSLPRATTLTRQWSLNFFESLPPWQGYQLEWLRVWDQANSSFWFSRLGFKQWSNHQLSHTTKGWLWKNEKGFGRRHKSNERETRMKELWMSFLILGTCKIEKMYLTVTIAGG